MLAICCSVKRDAHSIAIACNDRHVSVHQSLAMGSATYNELKDWSVGGREVDVSLDHIDASQPMKPSVRSRSFPRMLSMLTLKNTRSLNDRQLTLMSILY